MTTNMGSLDRGVRILIGLALIAWALGFVPGYAANAWAGSVSFRWGRRFSAGARSIRCSAYRPAAGGPDTGGSLGYAGSEIIPSKDPA
jgi:hypothetical protein